MKKRDAEEFAAGKDLPIDEVAAAASAGKIHRRATKRLRTQIDMI